MVAAFHCHLGLPSTVLRVLIKPPVHFVVGLKLEGYWVFWREWSIHGGREKEFSPGNIWKKVQEILGRTNRILSFYTTGTAHRKLKRCWGHRRQGDVITSQQNFVGTHS